MILQYKGKYISTKGLEFILNHYLNPFNIKVQIYHPSYNVSRQRGSFRIAVSLIKKVKYSAGYSQQFNPNYYSYSKEVVRREAFPHFYHFALFNDTIQYIMGKLVEQNYIIDWKLKSAILEFSRGENWREKIGLEYDPEYDPAFLRKNDKPVEYFKRIPIYSNREKMKEYLEKITPDRLAKRIKPAELNELTERILKITEAIKIYEERPPTYIYTLEDAYPIARAWYRFKYGEEAEETFYYHNETEKVQEYSELDGFLQGLDQSNPKYIELLKIWKEEMIQTLDKAIERLGTNDTILVDTDDAGFPLELAKKLVETPVVPVQVVKDKKKIIGYITFRDKQQERILT